MIIFAGKLDDMENRTSIYHRIFAYVLLVAVIFCSCESNVNVEKKSTPYRLSGGVYVEIVIIDSCEYIEINDRDATWGSHKGNCKFCAKRSK